MRRPPDLVTSIARGTQMHLTRKRIKCTMWAVLSVAKIAPGQERYYERSVATGIEDYYAGRGESPGLWTGKGAAALGLEVALRNVVANRVSGDVGERVLLVDRKVAARLDVEQPVVRLDIGEELDALPEDPVGDEGERENRAHRPDGARAPVGDVGRPRQGPARDAPEKPESALERERDSGEEHHDLDEAERGRALALEEHGEEAHGRPDAGEDDEDEGEHPVAEEPPARSLVGSGLEEEREEPLISSKTTLNFLETSSLSRARAVSTVLIRLDTSEERDEI